MSKLLKGSNSKFVVNLFKSFGVTLSLVAVSSCGDKGKDKNKVGSGEQGELNVETVFQDIDSLKKFAKKNNLNITNVKDSDLSKLLGKKFESEDALKAALSGLSGFKGSGCSGVEVGGNLDSRILDAVSAVKNASSSKIVAKLVELRRIVCESKLDVESKNCICEELPFNLVNNKFSIGGRVVVEDVKKDFKRYVIAVLTIRSWDSKCKISFKAIEDIGMLVSVGELRGVDESILEDKIVCKKGDKDGRLILGFGGGKEVDCNEENILKIVKILDLNSALFSKFDLMKDVVVDGEWDLKNKKVGVKVCGCNKVDVGFAGVACFKDLFVVDEVKGNGNAIELKKGGNVVCGIDFSDFYGFSNDCGVLGRLLGGCEFNLDSDKIGKIEFGDDVKVGIMGSNKLVFMGDNNCIGLDFLKGVVGLVEMGLCEWDSLKLFKEDGRSDFAGGENDGMRIGGLKVSGVWKKKNIENFMIFMNHFCGSAGLGVIFSVSDRGNGRVSIEWGGKERDVVLCLE